MLKFHSFPHTAVLLNNNNNNNNNNTCAYTSCINSLDAYGDLLIKLHEFQSLALSGRVLHQNKMSSVLIRQKVWWTSTVTRPLSTCTTNNLSLD
jgi:hypothetical protein